MSLKNAAGLRHLAQGSLARHFNQSELGEAVDRKTRVIARQGFVELLQHRLLVLLVFHVDEVDNDDPTKVPQAQLAGNGDRRLKIGLENGVVEVPHADEAAGIDVDRGHRLGLINDQIATRLQVNTTRQRLLNLVLNAVKVKQRTPAGFGTQPLRWSATASVHRPCAGDRSRTAAVR